LTLQRNLAVDGQIGSRQRNRAVLIRGHAITLDVRLLLLPKLARSSDAFDAMNDKAGARYAKPLYCAQASTPMAGAPANNHAIHDPGRQNAREQRCHRQKELSSEGWHRIVLSSGQPRRTVSTLGSIPIRKLSS